MNTKYIPLQELEKEIEQTEYNKGAIAMMKVVSEGMGWEETETYLVKKFFNINN